MAKFTVYLEQGEDGGWAAHCNEPAVVGGLGDTREAAIQDWKEAMAFWLAYKKDKGEEVTMPDTESIQVEVAA